MMELRPRQGNLRLVFRLFKSYARLAFPCRGLNPIIDSITLQTVSVLTVCYTYSEWIQGAATLPFSFLPPFSIGANA